MVQQQKILLYVDDDPDDHVDLIQTVSKMNAPVRVACAMNGVEALNYLEKAKAGMEPLPSLVLMDINMPKMTGKEVLSKLKKDDSLKRLPVVMYTTSGSDIDKAYCLSLGAADFLTKPLSQAAISLVVERCLSLMG